MRLKDQINQDLKEAMLAADKDRVTTLRGLKNTILYAELAANKREEGLSDDVIVSLLQKEAKKRQESADLYTQGNNEQKAQAELAEKVIIENYLPQQLTYDELDKLVSEVVATQPGANMQNMGVIISLVKQKVGSSADGSRIATLVKEKLTT